MSLVTNYLLLPGTFEEAPTRVAEVNASLALRGIHDQGFRLLDEDSWGGTRWPEMDVYGLAGNYVCSETAILALRAARWEEPDQLVVLACEQDDWGWRKLEIGESK